MSNKTNDSNQLSNYREIASAIKKSIEASGRVPPHKSVGGVLYRFLCTVSGNDVTLRINNWTASDWENTMTDALINYGTLTETEHVKWNNVQAATETLLSQIVFSNKDDIFGLFLKWIKSEKKTSKYVPSGFQPHCITETIKAHNESEKQKTFNLLRRVFKTNYDSTLVHIVNTMAEQPSTEDTFVALSEKAMAELLKHEAENIKLKAINSSLTAANNNLRHNDNNNPDILKITKESVFNRLKGLFPDNKAELIKELTDSFVDNKQTKNKYHVTDTAELFNKDVDIHRYKNQIDSLLHETKVKSMKINELERQIADLHRKYPTPVITVGSVTPTTPKEPEFDSKTAIEHLRTLVTLQETRLQKLENQQNPCRNTFEPKGVTWSIARPDAGPGYKSDDCLVEGNHIFMLNGDVNAALCKIDHAHLIRVGKKLSQVFKLGILIVDQNTKKTTASHERMFGLENYGYPVPKERLDSFMFVIIDATKQDNDRIELISTVKNVSDVPNPGSLTEPRYGWEHIDPETGASSFQDHPQPDIKQQEVNKQREVVVHPTYLHVETISPTGCRIVVQSPPPSGCLNPPQPAMVPFDTSVPTAFPEPLSHTHTEKEVIMSLPEIKNGELAELFAKIEALEAKVKEQEKRLELITVQELRPVPGSFSVFKVAELPKSLRPDSMYLVGDTTSHKFDI